MRFLCLIISFSTIFSQSWNNHPELNWQSFETENFIFYFHEETKRSAISTYKKEVESGQFPLKEHYTSIDKSVIKKI